MTGTCRAVSLVVRSIEEQCVALCAELPIWLGVCFARDIMRNQKWRLAVALMSTAGVTSSLVGESVEEYDLAFSALLPCAHSLRPAGVLAGATDRLALSLRDRRRGRAGLAVDDRLRHRCSKRCASGGPSRSSRTSWRRTMSTSASARRSSSRPDMTRTRSRARFSRTMVLPEPVRHGSLGALLNGGLTKP